jgi:hypothetical protein
MDTGNSLALEESKPVGVPAVPFVAAKAQRIVKGLGLDRFGLLGIVWIVIGYLSMWLGRAATKFVAEGLAKDSTVHAGE